MAEAAVGDGLVLRHRQDLPDCPIPFDLVAEDFPLPRVLRRTERGELQRAQTGCLHNELFLLVGPDDGFRQDLSLFKIGISLEAKKFGIREWWITALFSCVAGIVGILLVGRPAEALNIMVMIIGIAFLIEGLLNISVALSLVKIVKNQRPDLADLENY